MNRADLKSWLVEGALRIILCQGGYRMRQRTISPKAVLDSDGLPGNENGGGTKTAGIRAEVF
jgi:hypothetical protein